MKPKQPFLNALSAGRILDALRGGRPLSRSEMGCLPKSFRWNEELRPWVGVTPHPNGDPALLAQLFNMEFTEGQIFTERDLRVWRDLFLHPDSPKKERAARLGIRSEEKLHQEGDGNAVDQCLDTPIKRALGVCRYPNCTQPADSEHGNLTCRPHLDQDRETPKKATRKVTRKAAPRKKVTR